LGKKKLIALLDSEAKHTHRWLFIAAENIMADAGFFKAPLLILRMAV
jgi:hypothetical protein